MNHDSTSKMDLLKSKCDAVIGSMRIKTPLAYKGYTAYASFNPPPSDMDSTNENTFTYDDQHWVPLSSTAELDRQSIMTKHHYVAEPEWLPPVQTVQHRVPRPHSRGVKLRSVEAIVNDTQRQKAALASEERGHLPAVRMPARQQQPAQRQPPQPKSKVLDILDEIKEASRNSSSNSSTPTKFGLTPTSTTPSASSSHQNGNAKKQQSSIPSKRPSDVPNRQSLKKRTQPTIPSTTSTLRSAPPRPLATEKASSKTSDGVTKSRPKSSDTNLDLFLTKQFLISDLNDPAATRHLEDLSSLNVIPKRPILRLHIKMRLPKARNETRSKEVTMKPKNDTQASPVVNGDTSAFNLPTGTIPTEFIRSMKIRKKSKSDQAAAPMPSSPITAPPSSTATTSKSGRSHMVELEEGETISPSPSPRRPHSLSPERTFSKSTHKRQRDNSGPGDHEQPKQQSRRSKTSRKEVSLPLSSSSSSSSSTSTTSRHITAHDNGDDRHHASPSTTSSKSLARKDRYSTNDDDRRPTSSSSKRLERTTSAGDDSTSSDRRRSRYSSSSRRDEESSRHRSSQRSSGSRQRRSSRSISRSRSPGRRSSSSSSSRNRSSSQDKYRRHAPTSSSSSSSTTAAPPTIAASSSSVNRERSTPSVLNGPTAVKDTRTRDTVLTPAVAVVSPAIQAIKNESRDSTSVATPTIISSPAIQAIRNDSLVPSPGIIRNESSLSVPSPATSATGRVYPPATAPDAETPDQYRVFQRMFQKLALAYKRRGDHALTEISRLLDHFQAFLNFVLSFYFQDKLKYERLENSWDTLLPFSGVLLNKLRSNKAKDKRYDAIYGVCLRMHSLVHFYVSHRQEQFAKPKVNQLCQDTFDDTKRAQYSKVVQKMVLHNETAYTTLRESDRYMAFDVLQERFPVSFRDVCVNGSVGAGIVLGGEAGVTVGPMFPLVPYARLHHAAIMAKCLLQELVDTEGIDYLTITKTEDFM